MDFNAGIAVVAAGHAHPDVNAAIHAQVDDVLHYCSSDFYLPAYADVSERLARLAPISGETRTFLSNSGTEAVEAALKLARHHTGQTQRHRLPRWLPRSVARQPVADGQQVPPALPASASSRPGSFHAPYWDPYGDGGLTGAEYIEQVLFKKLTDPDDVAAVFVEPIQGEGGYIVPPAGWLAALRELCDRHGSCSCVDEVQSGIGRTGTMWACEHDGVEPDILCVGKGLASGLPLAGIVARTDLMDWEPGGHGSTFGGNPVACAAASATLQLVEQGLADNAAKVGAHLLSALSELATTASVPRAGPGPRPDDRDRRSRSRRRGGPPGGVLPPWPADADVR